MGKVCHFFHACRHGVWQFGRRVGIAPKNADDHQKQNGGRNVFVQSDDRAFVDIDAISHEFGAVKTYGPSNDENGRHEPVDVARDWMVVLLSHVVSICVRQMGRIIKWLDFLYRINHEKYY